MATLLDIAPELLRGTVMVAGAPLEIQALTTIDLARIMRRFPEFLKAARQLAGEPSSPDGADPGQLEALPALIAAGTGHPGDDANEAAAARLRIADQVNIVNEIMKLTMPEQSDGPLENGPVIDHTSTAPVNGSLQQ